MNFEFLRSPIHLIVFLSVVTVLVAAHEWGHYLFARLFRMEVEEFAIGFGPAKWIWRRKKTKLEREGRLGEFDEHDTIYTFRPLPLGGFVRIKGMTPEEDGSEIQIPHGFYSKPPWQRFLTLFAGPLFSVLAGYLILIPLYSVMGVQEASEEPVLEVGIGSEASKKGLIDGDRIVSLDDQPVQKFYDIMAYVRERPDVPIKVKYLRGSAEQTATLTPTKDESPTPVLSKDFEPTGESKIQGKIGIRPKIVTRPVGIQEAVGRATALPFIMAQGIAKMVAEPSRIKNEAGGVVTMYRSTTGAYELGWRYLLELCGLLTISIGVFNLLPIGPLDGGQMLIAFLEMLRGGKRLSSKFQFAVLGTGTLLLAALILTVTIFDIERWIKIDAKSREIEMSQKQNPEPTKISSGAQDKN